MENPQYRWKWIRALFASAVLGIVPGLRGAAAQDADDLAWRQARASGSVESYQGYLDRFPIGRHADEAFACIVARAKAVAGVPFCVIEPAAGPSAPAADPIAATLY